MISLAEHASTLPESLLKFAGTSADLKYRDYCDEHGYEKHPARMQLGLAMFFIQFLTEPGDLVVDPFGGSNTTGYAAELLDRKWLAVEASEQYARGSEGRFLDNHEELKLAVGGNRVRSK